MIKIANYIPNTVLTGVLKIWLLAEDNVFVFIKRNNYLIEENTYIKKNTTAEFKILLEKGSNSIEIKTLNLNGDMQIKNLKISYIERPDIIVDKNYGGNDKDNVSGIIFCKSLKQALECIPKDNHKRKIIFLRNGIYNEKVTIGSPNIALIGEDIDKTIVSYNFAAGFPKPDGSSIYGTNNSATVTVVGENFFAKNITFENTFDKSLPIKHTQAVAVRAAADKSIFINCKFKSTQDTLYADYGRQYYKNCYIEGDVDFIFGAAQAVFEDCIIFSLDREDRNIKGYVTAASTKPDNAYGFLFLRCKLISNISENSCVYLGRPWHPSDDPDRWVNVVFRECYLGKHIHQDGWTEMHGYLPEDERLYEYKNFGPGAAVNDKRPQLDEKLAAEYVKEKIFKDWNMDELSNI